MTFLSSSDFQASAILSKEDKNGNKSKEPDYYEDTDQLEEKQEEETGEKGQTTD